MHPLPGLCPAAQALQAMLVLGPFFTRPLWELVTSSLAKVPVQKIKTVCVAPVYPTPSLCHGHSPRASRPFPAVLGMAGP